MNGIFYAFVGGILFLFGNSFMPLIGILMVIAGMVLFMENKNVHSR